MIGVFVVKHRDAEKTIASESLIGPPDLFATSARTEGRDIGVSPPTGGAQWKKRGGTLTLICVVWLSPVLLIAQSESASGREVPELAELTVYYESTESINRISISPRSEMSIAPDLAATMRRIPGAALVDNGPISGQMQFRGLFDPRVHVLWEGVFVNSGGPNWMDPPLHYLHRHLTDSLEVIQGVAPVSAGEEAIGGSIEGKYYSIPYG